MMLVSASSAIHFSALDPHTRRPACSQTKTEAKDLNVKNLGLQLAVVTS
ncbi:MAG: hypothetical protein ACI8UO_005082 [Verrucomicrobiales bacterium]|jgi:hypothetical protein